MTTQELFELSCSKLGDLIYSKFKSVDFTAWNVAIGEKIAWSFWLKPGCDITIIREKSVQNRFVIKINGRVKFERYVSMVSENESCKEVKEVLDILCG